MRKYFLHNGTEQQGPFDIEELKAKELTKDTPVWFDDLNDWSTVGQVEELKHLVNPTPPPFAASVSTPPPVQKTEPQQNDSPVNQHRQNSSRRKLLLSIVGVILLGLVGVFAFTKTQPDESDDDRQQIINAREDSAWAEQERIREEENRKAAIRNSITSYVTAERSEFQTGFLGGGINNLKMSVTNNTDYLIDNVKVRIIYLKANGEVWDSKIIDFNLLEPQSKNTIKVADTKRGRDVKYEIISIKSAALNL